jgi:eukaryotic-like serine/threonine-protein kinase
MNSLMFFLRKTGHVERAVPHAVEYQKHQRTRWTKNPTGWASQLASESFEFLIYGEFRAPEPWLRECLTIRTKEQPDEWLTFNTQSMLGEALLGQKKYSEAEPLLVKGYEGMIAREKAISQVDGTETRIPEALDRLVWLYTATNRPAEVQRYRDLRTKYPKEQAPTPRAPRVAK